MRTSLPRNVRSQKYSRPFTDFEVDLEINNKFLILEEFAILRIDVQLFSPKIWITPLLQNQYVLTFYLTWFFFSHLECELVTECKTVIERQCKEEIEQVTEQLCEDVIETVCTKIGH